MISADDTESSSDEIKKPKRHGKNKSDVQTSENGNEISKRRLNKKSKSTTDENTNA